MRTPDTIIQGVINAKREFRCGAARPDGGVCNHFFFVSLGRVESLQHPCARCKAENLFHEPLPELELARLELARDQERTDLTLAHAMHDAVRAMHKMAENFSEVFQQRDRRLVMAQAA